MSDEPPIRLGLRVENVTSAAALYESLGFVPFATVPDRNDRNGTTVIAILRHGLLQLLVDALTGLPCTIVGGPLDAEWGERYVHVEDPFGYAWKFFRVT